jgi:hypothetical protein
MIELINKVAPESAPLVGSTEDLIEPLLSRSGTSPSLLYKPLAAFDVAGARYQIPRFIFLGPRGGAEPIRIGIFGAIHGDETATATAAVKFLELLDQAPELARDFCLFVYPVCNPTGFEDGTRFSRRGRDLNREFWNNSREPEVLGLQMELCTHAFDGIISLHADDTTDGVYGFVSGATLTESLIEPALQAAELFLPRNHRPLIDGFAAEKGIIREGYQGILSAPIEVSPCPFELVFETPHLAPIALQEQAFLVALLSILAEYRKTVSYAANL